VKKFTLKKSYAAQAALLASLCLVGGTANALDVALCAGQFTKMVAGQAITMWGYAPGGATGGVCVGALSSPGPEIRVPDTDPSLTINLTNTLGPETSLVIPGQAMPDGSAPVFFLDANDNQRVRSFTTEAAAGGIASSTWSAFKPGTYAYHSGTQPSLQSQMGMYGAAIKDAVAATLTTPAEAYPGVAYANEVVLFYSEIASALHDPTPTPARPLNYHPDYFLVNGEPFIDKPSATIAAGSAGQTTLVRMINMGIEQHMPVFQGLYLDVIAEDGNLYPHKRTQHTVMLTPVKTKDALVTANGAGTHAVYDAAMGLSNAGVSPGGMLAFLAFGAATVGDVVANADSYTTDEDVNLVTVAGGILPILPGVLDNDTGTPPLIAAVVTNPTNGTLSLVEDGSFTYAPNPDYNGADSFIYRASNATGSAEASVDITVTAVNDPPTAVDDLYEATEGLTLSVPTLGVLANDSDVDGDNLFVTTTPIVGPTGGTLDVLNANGSFDYTPDGFTYEVCDDGAPVMCSTAVVTINVVAAAGNQLPVAEPDFAEMQKVTTSVCDQTTGITIAVTLNDFDPDADPLAPNNGIDTSTVVITEPPNRGGTATFIGSGNVLYCPKKNFKGQEIFSYTVDDLAVPAATSNQADVTVNVLK
jgi:FtsP/CotA-like multicopper oxidase with cupredoxin domain